MVGYFSTYLAGTLSGRSAREVYRERSHAIKCLNEIGVTVFDPMREKYKALMERDDLGLDSTKITYEISEITQRDLNDIDNANLLTILTGDIASWGTALEYGYAIWRPQRKPVLLIGPKTYAKVQDNQFAWQSTFATKVVPTIEAGCEWLKNFWLSPPANPVILRREKGRPIYTVDPRYLDGLKKDQLELDLGEEDA